MKYPVTHVGIMILLRLLNVWCDHGYVVNIISTSCLGPTRAGCDYPRIVIHPSGHWPGNKQQIRQKEQGCKKRCWKDNNDVNIKM